MNMYKNVLIVFCILFSLAVNAQKQETHNKITEPSNWFVGGSVSIGAGNGSFNAGIHPHVGYTLAKWIDVAAVTNLEYQTQRDNYNTKYRSTTYGFGAFTRIFPVHFLFIQAEPEYNFIKQKYIPSSGPSDKLTLHAPSLLLGGGYITSRTDKNTFTYLSILFDVIKDIHSPYIDGYGKVIPIIRAGINVGLNRTRRTQ